MARAFYGRLAAYDAAITAGDRDGAAAALLRNLYRKSTPAPEQVAAMTDYLFAEAARLAAITFERVRVGAIAFGAPPQPGNG